LLMCCSASRTLGSEWTDVEARFGGGAGELFEHGVR
jgi:hypothetical protein